MELVVTRCVWTFDADLEAWKTTCGGVFDFAAGGPEENAFDFCPYCGAVLHAKPAAGQENTDD
jgi:hypothetical protein